MFSSLTDLGFSLLVTFDLPALFALFVLKGAIIGKPFPTSVFLPGYIAVSPSQESIWLVILVASIGYVSGQLVIYWLAATRGVDVIHAIPRVSISDEQLEQANDVFKRYSGAGIFVTNLVPYVGSFVMIPAGIARYSIRRATVYAFTSTLLNYVAIVWIVFGSLELLLP
ncbi:membrane-associated protein [Natronolimnobius sp. AArcel1]|uniref:DedA family protein n=1 Tax=Natronolimnobius sp. AArcel1 TaxID=1679093 RepID=UPI0013EC26C6|nr:VTT domain-containing protein [Natronolimnobius sp. AArcel1]NGM70200.1 membrane-associated protein [Natronolimnobius sp. AArcel1]